MVGNKYIKLSDISDHRQLLMGIGIIGVMFSHWFGFQSINQGIPYLISDFIVKMVFTEGFLFLSGFGLYYSFSSNSDIKFFYRKRIARLYVPFFILSFPLYTYFLFARDDYGYIDYFKQLSTLFFWTDGNYGGMWYVSLSLVLYFVFPFIFKFIFRKEKFLGVLTRVMFLLLLLYILIFFIMYVDKIYYEKISIGVGKIIFFIIGCLFGYIVKKEAMSFKSYTFLVYAIIAMYIVFTTMRLIAHVDGVYIKDICGVLQKFSFMPVLCITFNVFNKSSCVRYISDIINWFGKYSLELYLLHLHFFMFLHFGFLKDSLPVMYQATIAIILALFLCIPINKSIAYLTNKWFK